MTTKLITGGYGLVGSEFTSGTKIGRQDCDLTDSLETQRFFESVQPDMVVHTAARVGGVLVNTDKVYDFFLDNLRINTNVIDSARRVGVKKLLAFSSTCVMPDKTSYPLQESYLHMGPPHVSNFGYAYAKRMIDIQIQACNQQYHTSYFTVIPTNVYGPWDNYNMQNGHVLPSLIHKCFLAKKNGEDFEVWGTGNALREFVFSRDVAKICDILLDNHQTSESIIISTSQEYSIKHVVDLICGIMEYKGKVVYNTDRPEGQHRKPTDISRLKSIIGNFEFTPLHAGLEETIGYFIENFDSVRK
jgi:GDP-L-fucose synthase